MMPVQRKMTLEYVAKQFYLTFANLWVLEATQNVRPLDPGFYCVRCAFQIASPVSTILILHHITTIFFTKQSCNMQHIVSKTSSLLILLSAVTLPTVKAILKKCRVDIEVKVDTKAEGGVPWGGPVTIRARSFALDDHSYAARNLLYCLQSAFDFDGPGSGCDVHQYCQYVDILDEDNNDAVLHDGHGRKLTFNEAV